MQGETSFTSSYTLEITSEGFIFIPRLPASYIIDDELYQKIFLIANASLYPRYTLLKQNSAYFISLDTDDIHVQRGLFFPWQEGVSERLIISDLEEFAIEQEESYLPIMKNLSLDYNKVTSIDVYKRQENISYLSLHLLFDKQFVLVEKMLLNFF